MNLYPGSALTADEVFEFAAPRVVVATGATWRRDGVGRFNFEAVPGTNSSHVLTPDDLFDGAQAKDPVVIYDEDGAYLGNLIAEKLHAQGHAVTVVTPHAEVAPYLALTMEQHKVAARLVQLGIPVERLKRLSAVETEQARLACVHGGVGSSVAAGTVVLLTSRSPCDALYLELEARREEWSRASIASVDRIGDCVAPSIIAAAVHSGHRWAIELDREPGTPVAHLPMAPGS